MKLNTLYEKLIQEKKLYKKESTIYTYNSVYNNHLKSFFNKIKVEKINIKTIECIHNYLNNK